MQSAPSVTYPVGRSRFYAALAAALWLMGGCVTALWADRVTVLDWRQALMLCLWLGSGALLGLAWWRSPHGLLRWDGQAWNWEAGAGISVPGVLSVHLDLQRMLLLSLRLPSGMLLWLWLTRQDEASQWLALRRAVYMSVKAATAPKQLLASGHSSR